MTRPGSLPPDSATPWTSSAARSSVKHRVAARWAPNRDQQLMPALGPPAQQ